MDLLTCDSCGLNFPEDEVEVSKNDLVVCQACKKAEDEGEELLASEVISEVKSQLGAGNPPKDPLIQ